MTSDPAYEAISKARRQVNGNNVNGAINTLETYLATDPHNTKPRMELAKIAIYDLKNLRYGIMQLEIVLDLEPDNIDAMKAAVTVMGKDKKYNKRTIELFEKLLSMESGDCFFTVFSSFFTSSFGASCAVSGLSAGAFSSGITSFFSRSSFISTSVLFLL